MVPPYSVSWAQLLNISLNTDVILYDIKCVTEPYYHVTNLVGLTDSDCIYIYIYIYIPSS